jgi:hypothetical protein
MSVLKYQSDDELLRVMVEWVTNFFPPNVVKNERNVQLIGDRCVAKYGFVSIIGLTEAAHELGAANLELIPQPKPLTALEHANLLAEKAAKAQARDLAQSKRDQLANSESAFFERVKNAEKAKAIKEEADKQASAEKELEVTIDGYQAYLASGKGIDISTTSMVKADLKTIVFRVNGKKDFVRTVAAIRQIVQALPDHPVRGDVVRVMERINVENAAEKERQLTAPRVKGIW